MERRNEIRIIAPEGYELIKNGNEYTFRKIQKLPKTWEEFCEMNSIEEDYFIDTVNKIINGNYSKDIDKDKSLNTSVLNTVEQVNALIALIQLIELRDCYRGEWKPDFSNLDQAKYAVGLNDCNIDYSICYSDFRIFSFQSSEIRNEFGKNFGELLRKIKPLF